MRAVLGGRHADKLVRLTEACSHRSELLATCVSNAARGSSEHVALGDL